MVHWGIRLLTPDLILYNVDYIQQVTIKDWSSNDKSTSRLIRINRNPFYICYNEVKCGHSKKRY